MAIQTLAYKMVMDTSDFLNGLGLTKTELRASKQLFEQTRTPIERYEQALHGLGRLQEKLPQSSDLVQRSIKKLREEFWGLGEAAEEAEKPTQNLFAVIAGGVTVGSLLSSAFNRAFDLVRSGVSALVDGVEVQFDRAVKLGQIAERTGIDSMQLGGFELLSDKLGMDFERVAVSLQKMQIRIGEAATVGGEASKTFERLGLNVKQLASMSVDQQFIAIAQAMRLAGNETEQLALAAKIFEAEGTDMARLFGLTADQLSDAVSEAERLGIALDKTQLFEIQNANEAIKEMQALWSGVGRTLAVEVAAPVVALVNTIKEARNELEMLGDMMPGGGGVGTAGTLGVRGAQSLLENVLPAPLGPLVVAGAEATQYAGGQVFGLIRETQSAVESERRTREMERDRQRRNAEYQREAQQLNNDLSSMLKPREKPPEMSSVTAYNDEKRKLEQEQRERERMRTEAERQLQQLESPLDTLSRRLDEISEQFVRGTIEAKEMRQLEGAARKDYFAYVDKEAESRLKQGEAKAGPTTAVLKGSTEAFAAERERARIEDDRYREEVRRETLKLEVLSEIRNNTKPENQTRLDVVEV